MLPHVMAALNPDGGVFYLLLIEENLSVIPFLEEYGLTWTVVMKREVMGEN